MAASKVKICLVDRDPEIMEFSDQISVEGAVHQVCWTVLQVKPVAWLLYGFFDRGGEVWLPAHRLLRDFAGCHLELRLRLKVPTAVKLYEVCPATFAYAFTQIRRDFLDGLIVDQGSAVAVKAEVEDRAASSHGPEKPKLIKKAKLGWAGLLTSEVEELNERREEHVSRVSHTVRMMHLIMTVDIHEKDHSDMKTVINNVNSYWPKNKDLLSTWQRRTAKSDLKDQASRIIGSWVKQPTDRLKMEFLTMVERDHRAYFSEIFVANLQSLAKRNEDVSQVNNVQVVVNAPYTSADGKSHEKASIDLIHAHGQVEREASVSDICSISTSQSGTGIQILRKNGIPVYLNFETQILCHSFLTLVSAYFRLSDKWTFNLCDEVSSPHLNFLMSIRSHGPVDYSFVKIKFEQWAKSSKVSKYTDPGTYLIQMDETKGYQFLLYYKEKTGNIGVIHLEFDQTDSTFWVLEYKAKFKTVQEIIDYPEGQIPTSGGCLRPSDFDKMESILICTEQGAQSLPDPDLKSMRIFLFHDVKKVMTSKEFKGRFTSTFEGKLTLKDQNDDKTRVAIEQLTKENRHLTDDFLKMIHESLRCQDATIRTVYGITLSTDDEPAMMIKEFFEYGPLDRFLAESCGWIEPVDLVEAGTMLARALWYLHTNNIVHANIRCHKVFVMSKDTNTFKVKLAEPGLREYDLTDENAHWIPFDLLNKAVQDGFQRRLTKRDYNVYSDVWAFGTTLWQIMSLGKHPGRYGRLDDYRHGHILPRPEGLKHPCASMIYSKIIKRCWMPDPMERIMPQEIMKEMNQILYRVFNSKKLPAKYVYIDERVRSASCASTAIATSFTASGSHTGTGQTDCLSTADQKMRREEFKALTFGFQNMSQGCKPPEVSEGVLDSVGGGVVAVDTSAELLQDIGIYGSSQMNPSHLEKANQWFERTFKSQGGLSNFQYRELAKEGGDTSSFDNYASQCTSKTTLTYESGSENYKDQYSLQEVYDMDEQSLQILWESQLGSGNFGMVFKGIWTKADGEWKEVAVKVIKDSYSADYTSRFEIIRELSIMKELKHVNIVGIEGICHTRNFIIMEYIKEGSLDTYLKINRDKIKFPKQLFGYALNIVDGMEYMAQKGIIHRDLAARNVLVADEETVKISDFGLSRLKTEGKEYYLMSTNANIPVKWMAIESLNENKYTTASDVWSFGVVLWEMFSFGKNPTLTECEDFFTSINDENRIVQDYTRWVELLQNGTRLPCPENCPDVVYSKLMMPCWHGDPQSRPGFHQLQSIVKEVELRVT